jgi:hypothetical protein
VVGDRVPPCIELGQCVAVTTSPGIDSLDVG